MSWPAYQAAGRCTGKTQPGAQAMMDWAVRDFGQGARNYGIYNCRSVRGSTNRSVHGEGRALDVGFSGSGNPAGTRLVQALLPHVGTLGIQMIIWNRRIYSARYPKGAAYTGVNPHTDHVHIELTWDAAYRLTRTRIQQVMNAAKPPPVVDWNAIRRWNAGLLLPRMQGVRTPLDGRGWVEDIKLLQQVLNIVKNANIVVDGKFGPITYMHVVDFQNSCRKLGLKIIDPQGVVGDSTKWWLCANLQNIRDGR